jgi:ribosomal protein S6--L-glutamate ligase
MKLAILSRKPSLYSTRRLVKAARDRGHEARVFDPLHCYMSVSTDRPAIYYKGEELMGYDAVIPRIGASITFYGTAVLRQFEMLGVYPVNESVAITRARDKLRSLQLLARKGIPLPVTGFAQSPDDIQHVISMVGGAPLVLKMIEGTQGIGVVLAETPKAAESVIDAFFGLKVNILVQQYIREARGADIRCFVIGDKVVAAMRRQAREGDFRSNLHRGGTASPIKLTPEERAIAVHAAKVIGLNVAGVDLLRSDRGPLVLEVNSSPGLEGIEQVTNRDIAGMIVEFAHKNARANRTRTRGKG